MTLINFYAAYVLWKWSPIIAEMSHGRKRLYLVVHPLHNALDMKLFVIGDIITKVLRSSAACKEFAPVQKI